MNSNQGPGIVYVVHDPELQVRVCELAPESADFPEPPPATVWLVVERIRSRFAEPQCEQTISISSCLFITSISMYSSQSMHLNSKMGILISFTKKD
jgi:hypothetical protein